MAGRILIVGGSASQCDQLRTKLASAFYQVATVASGAEALRSIDDLHPDLVLSATMLPDMCSSGFCTRLRSLPGHADTPLVLLCEKDQPERRLALLAVGADDVIARPVEDILLLARLRNLIHRSRAQDELQLRNDTQRALGLSELPRNFDRPARISLVPLDPEADVALMATRLRINLGAQVRILAPGHLLKQGVTPAEAIVLIDNPAAPEAGLAFLSQLRTARARRRAALVYVTEPERAEYAARALDLGADELLHRGPDALELALRLPRLINRRRRAEQHHAALRNGLRAAIIDPLTGLYNRRYAMPELARLAQQAAELEQPLALLIADLDHFKKVNDHWGHSIGDRVLATTARALSDALRPRDLVARVGGEEFLIALPGSDAEAALATARQLRERIAGLTLPLIGPGGGSQAGIALTISIGIAFTEPGSNPVETVLRRADGALYAAKQAGRNQVRLAEPERQPQPWLNIRELRRI
ncbi:diguanylate cyclase [Alloyangia pacifica]|uniref:diguanylate cyclase n=1 Tax=Alloyangia pacifica TaxID=311180 RepID=A0A1I6W217_9RHOB|nr:diguanylate cyclase [Alloyangia pacifica]SDI38329.1 two-component system, cell cycle response regulator [Alloyangia pacifica]SFT20032.1 two-component system, cell cycle response regulator [Alloyangia pacifica]